MPASAVLPRTASSAASFVLAAGRDGVLFAAHVRHLGDGESEDCGELVVGESVVRLVGERLDEREAGKAPGAFVAVGRGQLVGKHVARVERHERDKAFGGVPVGQRFDVRGEPEALA